MALCAVYAFMRHCDDIVDETSLTEKEKEEALGEIVEFLSKLESGKNLQNKEVFWPALIETVYRYQIPTTYLIELVKGVGQDTGIVRFKTWDELYRYCYRVASVVGFVTLHIIGFTGQEALTKAEYCGVAFQLTNILRDLKQDVLAGRLYIPAEDLCRFNVSEEDLLYLSNRAGLRGLLEYEISRARTYYRSAQGLERLVPSTGRAFLRALIGIYSELLEEIAKDPLRIFRERVELSGWRKTAITLRAALWG